MPHTTPLAVAVLVLLLPPLAVATDAPDDVIFETDVEFANPDGQHLPLNLARPKTSDGPFPAVICIHGGGFRAGTR